MNTAAALMDYNILSFSTTPPEQTVCREAAPPAAAVTNAVVPEIPRCSRGSGSWILFELSVVTRGNKRKRWRRQRRGEIELKDDRYVHFFGISSSCELSNTLQE